MDTITRTIIIVLDNLAEWTGRLVAWLILAMMLLTCLVVLMRYGFGQGSIGLQESVMYLHGTVFMLGIAYTLNIDLTCASIFSTSVFPPAPGHSWMGWVRCCFLSLFRYFSSGSASTMWPCPGLWGRVPVNRAAYLVSTF